MAKIWTGDFSTGDLSQWSAVESVDPSTRLMVVAAPGRTGAKALQVTVKQGDTFQNGTRNELDYMGKEPIGSERWYTWSTMFPTTFPVTMGNHEWQVFTQWHQDYVNGQSVGISPPVAMSLLEDQMQLITNDVADNEYIHWTSPIVRGVWMDFLLHVCWSSDPTKGFLELTVNGKLVLPKVMTATNLANWTIPNYLKQGLYRNADIVPDAVIYHMGFTSYDAPPNVPMSGVTGRLQDANGHWWTVSAVPD